MVEKSEDAGVGTRVPLATPLGFRWLQGLIVLVVLVLATIDLLTPVTEVPWVVYGLLGGIAGGPEVWDRLRVGSS